jgi:membrane protein
MHTPEIPEILIKGKDKATQLIGPQVSQVVFHPLDFTWQTIKAFRANQGLLLAGALAYNALLSIVPLLILIVLTLSRYIPQAELLQTIGDYLEWLVPGQSQALVTELANFMQHREVVSWVLLASMMFFSSLAFSGLENAMSVIFEHRNVHRPRHPLLSFVLPYLWMASLAAGLLVMTVVASALNVMGDQSVYILHRTLSLEGVSAALLYLLGVGGEVCILTAIYIVMPVGRLSIKHALLGGISATILWEITRHLLVWYFSTISLATVVYGSLTTAILAMLGLEIAALLVLFGAQVISEYEKLGAHTKITSRKK